METRDKFSTAVPSSATVVCDALLVFLAVWPVAAQFAFICELNFRQYWTIAWAASISSVAIFFALSGRASRAQETNQETFTPREKMWALAAMLLAAILTLCLHRPDADDEFYLGFALISLDNPAAQISALPMWRDFWPNYALASHETQRAALSWLTGIPLLTSYYLVWPAILAIVVVALQCRLLKLLRIKSLAFGLVIFFVVMLVWGDVHRTPANFGFVRMFQGKAALVWITVPAALFYWLRYITCADKRSLFLLHCAIVGGTGFSPTGVLMGILLTGLFLLSTLAYRGMRREHISTFLNIAGLAIYPLLIGIFEVFILARSDTYTPRPPGIEGALKISQSINATTGGNRRLALQAEMIDWVLGHDLRGIVALLCAVGLPLFLRPSSTRRLLATYSILCTALLLFPWSSEWFGKYGFKSFAWRWLYAIPFVLALVIAAERVAWQSESAMKRAVIASIMLLVFVSPGSRLVVSKQNETSLKLPAPKTAAIDHIYLRPYSTRARIEGPWLVSPNSGRRY